MKQDFYIEKFLELFPEESVQCYFVFLRRDTGFLSQILLSSSSQIVLFRTKNGQFIWARINSAGRFVSPLENTTPKFKHARGKKLQVSGSKEYNGLYRLVKSFQPKGKDKKQVIEKLIGGDYDD